MKKGLIIVAIILCICTVSYAVWPEEQVLYEVTIEVTYNAVPPDEAKEIIANALKTHSKACSVSTKTKKAGSDSGYLTFSTSDYVISN